MAAISPAPPALSGDLSVFHTTDPLLANAPVLIFHGPAASIGSTSSRIQVHIFTPAGTGSYARLAVSPNSPLYSAVSNLPREEQGDEVCRGLAFGLKKYFSELDEKVKKAWCARAKAPMPAMLFGDDHIAVLASRMTKIQNVPEVIEDVQQGFAEQRLSWLDVDVVLPAGTIKEGGKRGDSAGFEELDERQLLEQRYGAYAELIGALGEATFLPTSTLKRAPSRPIALGRSLSFLRSQKEAVRIELSQLLDTEQSYVQRIQELSDLSHSIGADLKPSSRDELRAIFPASLDEVVITNAEFCNILQLLLNDTEQSAVEDIEAATEEPPSTEEARQNWIDDPQGIGAIAECFCEWFPKFSKCYASYMAAHAQSAQRLRALLRDEDSAISSQLHDVGDQRLTSLLIEPVQRLPRYNLYIDNVAKQLPARHPALKSLYKARDIITDICSQDDTIASGSGIADRLASKVNRWPSDVNVRGRLIAAVDISELVPPYHLEGCALSQGIILLFADCLVVLEKRGTDCMSARALLAELESSGLMPQPLSTRPITPQGLQFVDQIPLEAVSCLEGQDGYTIHMTTHRPDASSDGKQSDTVAGHHIFKLEGSYEGKAARLIEDMTKARVEARFSEAERECAKWEVRATQTTTDYFTLLSAVFDDADQEHVQARRNRASVRIMVDIDKHSQRPRAGQLGINTVVTVSPVSGGLWRLCVESLDGPASREHVPAAELVNVVRRRLGGLVAAGHAISQPSLTSMLLQQHESILQSIELKAVPPEEGEDKPPVVLQQQNNRPKSPVKMLSSFLSSQGPGSQHPSFRSQQPSGLSNIPRMPPPPQPVSKPPSRENRPASKDLSMTRPVSSARSTEHVGGAQFKKLEDALSAYILALQARKGNIVGRSLKMRATADAFAVNELYNSLLDDPNMMVYAAEATVDVLFAAFEKFLNVAWKQQMGPIVPYQTMQAIQSKAESMFPVDFDNFFKTTLATLSPQNQRAFKAIVSLLADLLDGTGNDGDRGILTAAFAEVLVTEGNPHDYIALIDRFVDDTDTYFGEPLEEQRVAEASGPSHKRARSENTGSLTSNTSSLRRKFGFGGLSRENSKSEQESKVASVWRTLSKGGNKEHTPSNSLTRSTLNRAHSTDMDARFTAARRPTSQDGPPANKPLSFDDTAIAANPAAASTTNLGLSTIGEHPSFIPQGPPKKKRRSSLSDLKALDVAQQQFPCSPPAARGTSSSHAQVEDKSLPASPAPSTPSSLSKGSGGKFGSIGTPSQGTPRSRLPASFRKENTPPANKALASPEPRLGSHNPLSPETQTTGSPARGLSNIPSLRSRASISQRPGSSTPVRSGLYERPSSGNTTKQPPTRHEKPANQKPAPTSSNAPATPTTPSSPPKRLRMQSPAKLRERLQNEHSNITSAHHTLQDELSKIGDELTSLHALNQSVRQNSVRGSPAPNRSNTTAPSSPHRPTSDFAARILKLESSIPTQISNLSATLSTLQSDVATSLTISENKCRKLDALYREANGENEALYAKFNSELERVLKAVRGGEGVEALKQELKGTQYENAGLKREVARLKRENLGLRVQIRQDGGE